MRFVIILIFLACCVSCKDSKKPYDPEKEYRVVKMVMNHNLDLPYRADWMYFDASKNLDTILSKKINEPLRFKIKKTRDSIFDIYQFIYKNDIQKYRVKSYSNYLNLRMLEKYLLEQGKDLMDLKIELDKADKKGFVLAEKKYPNSIEKQNYYSIEVTKGIKNKIYNKYKLDSELQIYSGLLYLID